ncbi:MAG: M12 family metallopeptidase [Acidobacteriota bacterium]|nr:M12 family metallopeptidase [Acidobacteriota bacterium]
MKNKTKLFAPTILCLRLFLLLVALFWFAPLTNAQDSKPSQKLIIKPIPDGYTIIDGDIVMPSEFVEAILRKKDQSPLAPEATYRTNLWTNGIIPFEFQITNALPSNCPNATPSGSVSSANQSVMISAMAVLETVANGNFQQCAGASCPNGSRVLVRDTTNDIIRNAANNCVSGAANSSRVGMVGGQQIINIVSWNSQFIIIHELLHALGFYHEHIRPDRNTFVQINCGNVQGGCGTTFFNTNFSVPGDASAYGYYDFDSLMHYSQCEFSIDCPPGSNCACTNTVMTVLAPNQSQQTLIGQRTHLSVLDQATLSFLYPFDNWRFLDCTYNGSNGASDGSFLRPYTTLAAALANTPAGGTIWVLRNCYFQAAGTYGNRVTIRAAPGVTATFGG